MVTLHKQVLDISVVSVRCGIIPLMRMMYITFVNQFEENITESLSDESTL